MMIATPTPIPVIESGARFCFQKSGFARDAVVTTLGRLSGPVVVVPAAHVMTVPRQRLRTPSTG